MLHPQGTERYNNPHIVAEGEKGELRAISGREARRLVSGLKESEEAGSRGDRADLNALAARSGVIPCMEHG